MVERTHSTGLWPLACPASPCTGSVWEPRHLGLEAATACSPVRTTILHAWTAPALHPALFSMLSDDESLHGIGQGAGASPSTHPVPRNSLEPVTQAVGFVSDKLASFPEVSPGAVPVLPQHRPTMCVRGCVSAVVCTQCVYALRCRPARLDS